MPRRKYGELAATIRAAAEGYKAEDGQTYEGSDLDGKAEIERAIARGLSGVHASEVRDTLRRGKPGRPPSHVCTCPACGRKHKPLKETP